MIRRKPNVSFGTCFHLTRVESIAHSKTLEGPSKPEVMRKHHQTLTKRRKQAQLKAARSTLKRSKLQQTAKRCIRGFGVEGSDINACLVETRGCCHSNMHLQILYTLSNSELSKWVSLLLRAHPMYHGFQGRTFALKLQLTEELHSLAKLRDSHVILELKSRQPDQVVFSRVEAARIC